MIRTKRNQIKQQIFLAKNCEYWWDNTIVIKFEYKTQNCTGTHKQGGGLDDYSWVSWDDTHVTLEHTHTFSFHRLAKHSAHPDRVVCFSLELQLLQATLVVSALGQSYCCGTALDFRIDIWYFVIGLQHRVISNWLRLYLHRLA